MMSWGHPCKSDRHDINSHDRHVDTADHQGNSAASPILRYCHHHRLNDDSRTSAAELHWWSAFTVGGRHTHKKHQHRKCCPHPLHRYYLLCQDNRITCLSLSSEKHHRMIETESRILHLWTKSPKVTLKCGNILPTEELAVASYCMHLVS